MDTDLRIITELIAKAIGTTPEALRAKVERDRVRAVMRVANHNARYEQALWHITPVQSAKMEELRRGGASVHDRIRQDRRSNNIVMFAQQQKWNSAKGCMGCQLFAVYPDGSVVTTFEKTISVKPSF